MIHKMPVPEEVSLYLERLFTDHVSVKELLISVLPKDTPLTKKHKELLVQHIETYASWAICYEMLYNVYVHYDLQNESDLFSFADKSFIINKGDGKEMFTPIKSSVTPEERDALQRAFYDKSGYTELIDRGIKHTEIMAGYLQANREYNKIWDELLRKYFPDMDFSGVTDPFLKWDCNFSNCEIIVHH